MAALTVFCVNSIATIMLPGRVDDSDASMSKLKKINSPDTGIVITHFIHAYIFEKLCVYMCVCVCVRI